MNVYSELLELLAPKEGGGTALCFGVVSGVNPLRVTVGGAEVSRGLAYPRGSVFRKEDVGCEVALLSREGGFLILFQVEGGDP